MQHDAQDRIQRALNEQKRRRLEETYGARFSFSNSDTPPQIISEWLDTIEEFERLFQEAPPTTVRAFTGITAVTPPHLLPSDSVAQELRRLLEFLDAHAIAVHFGRAVPPEEVYRFVVDELLDHEIDDVRVEGLTHNFVYEDFHPDEAAEAMLFAGHFLHNLFKSDRDVCHRMVDDTETYTSSGKPCARKALASAIEEFLAGVAVFTGSEISDGKCTLEGEYASVAFAVSWNALQRGTLQQQSGVGTATLRLKRSAQGWNVVQVECPGWRTW